MTMWSDDYEHDMADPQDGKEPFKTWWEDMRPVEVRTLVKNAYERGYDAAIRERDEADATIEMMRTTISDSDARIVELTLHCDQTRHERDEARVNARILAHAWNKGSDPPLRVVAESLAYKSGRTLVEPAEGES